MIDDFCFRFYKNNIKKVVEVIISSSALLYERVRKYLNIDSNWLIIPWLSKCPTNVVFKFSSTSSISCDGVERWSHKVDCSSYLRPQSDDTVTFSRITSHPQRRARHIGAPHNVKLAEPSP